LQSDGEDAFDAALRRPSTSSDPFYTEARTNQIQEFAVFGESDINLTSRLTAIVGARWFRFRVRVDSDVAQSRGNRNFDDVATYSAFSPKLTLQYRWSDRTLIYAQAAEGYRAGGFNTSGLIGQPFDRTFNSPARRYDPDELWNFETGLKTTFFQERLQLRAAVFYAYWRDIQTDQFLNSGLPYTANAGDGANAGLEVEATAKPAPNWQVRFAGLIDDPHLVRASPAFASRIDAGIPGVPSSSANVGVTYTRALSRSRTLQIDGQVAYVGASHLTFDAQHLLTQGDYFNTGLSLAIQGRRLRTTLFVDNALDGRGNTFAFGDPFRIRRSMEATPLRPRTIGVRLGAAF
jgi:outer membrane receptor protein involved in Fe transport